MCRATNEHGTFPTNGQERATDYRALAQPLVVTTWRIGFEP